MTISCYACSLGSFNFPICWLYVLYNDVHVLYLGHDSPCSTTDGCQPKISEVLYCTDLYCTVLICTVLYWSVLYCTVLHVHCTVLYYTVLHLWSLHYYWLMKGKGRDRIYTTCNQYLIPLGYFWHFQWSYMYMFFLALLRPLTLFPDSCMALKHSMCTTGACDSIMKLHL